ncbi:MAG TPA: pyridoxamine 5'-phosphate oxidase family protein [Bacteroidales bacterium]|nr:pyridoxamine 5'-phosphate oxidase family protein [Bacteroidales bacterium]
MRRHDKEIKDPLVIEDIVNRSELCRIGLVEDGMAYIVPLNYGYANGMIYMHSAPNGRKMEILKQNSRVSFEIEFSGEVVKKEEACRWTAKYRSVMGRGTVEIVSEPERKRFGMDIIMRKYGFEGEINYDDASLSRMVILELKIEAVQGKQSGDW